MCGGVVTYAGLHTRENALRDIPKNGYVFHGPNWSQGKNLVSKEMPKVVAHAWRCSLGSGGTTVDSCLESMKAVACCHKNLAGRGSVLPPNPGRSSKIGSVSPQELRHSAVLYTADTCEITAPVGKYALAGKMSSGRTHSWKRATRS